MKVRVTKKKIKNIIIKINDMGEVLVSAPLNVPNYYIEKVLKEKEEWIRERLELLTKRKKKIVQYDSGEIFSYLGKRYTIEIQHSTKEYCQLKNDKFIIYLKENSFEKRKTLINTWICDNFCPFMMELTMNISEKIGYTPEIVKFRDMKTRWGSCNSKNRSITYNYQLYKKSREIIEYVVLHELSHIPYPHHQKSFWDFVEKYMPDWKIRRKLLKESSDE
ncbi:M48 family metallopeptidase [Fusobacterium sp.]|uniref:M48 family metallopeptidase n=1 Tax=Fusobacterium sp. TaxID=68766 RepID=UPI0025BFC625|nr:SprT family zinc-dependent metalloprotease [Fusobacterium sp.]